jgi:Bacteriocin-protection, YdeI or OmpD-Associated/Domain of unknown function (DUF1905)
VSVRSFTAVLRRRARGGVLVPVPFAPEEAWGAKSRHHVTGTVDGRAVRGTVEPVDGGYGLLLGPAWARDCAVAIGVAVPVELAPEGPQRGELPDDLAAALAAEPAAGVFFDSLAQFYRRAYLRWIDATKRRPDVRAERIAEMVELLRAGRKERPKA